MDYEIDFGAEFARYEGETETKGWFDARVKMGETSVVVSFYDPIRLGQEVQDALDRGEVFVEKNIVVVPKVNRENMEKALKVVSAKISFTG